MNNFDLKKFLAENRLTPTSKQIKEALNDPQATTPEELAKKVKQWYDWWYHYADGQAYDRAIARNGEVEDWFNSHPLDLKIAAYEMLKDLVSKDHEGSVEYNFKRYLKEQVAETLSTDAHDRMHGLVPLSALAEFQTSMKIIADDLLEEGFDLEDVVEFLKSVVEDSVKWQ
jgi:hypothetical protein